MSKSLNEIKKVCQFLSQILARWQYNDDFSMIKTLLIELFNGSIDFYRFKEIFPHKLPSTCLDIMEFHLNLIREQFAMGLLDIQFISNSEENKNPNKSSYPLRIQNNPVINVNSQKIIPNTKPLQNPSFGNHNKFESKQNLTPSNTIIRPVSFSTNDKTKMVKVYQKNPIPSKCLPPSDSSLSNQGSIIQIGSQNQRYSTETKLKIIKTESIHAVIPAKKKIIGISNQCDTHSELKELPSLQTFDLSNATTAVKIEKKLPTTTATIPNDCLLESSAIATEEKIQFIVDDAIGKVAKSFGIISIDYDNIIPYVQAMLDVFIDDLLVQAAYYTAHRENCKNTFKSDSVLYKETDNARAYHKTLKNKQQLIISNQEREEKEKNYLEKGKIADGMKRKEEMKVFLSNSSVHKSNNVFSNIFGSSSRKVNCAPTVPTIAIKKRITAKDFLLVFRQKRNLQKIKAYKLLVAAVNQ